MSHPLINGRRFLVVGPGLEPIAAEALPGARLETAPPQALGRLADPGVAAVLIDADAGDPALLAAAIDSLAAGPAAPPAVLVGQRLPTVLVRALLKLRHSDVLEAPFGPADLALTLATLLTHAAPSPGHVAQSPSRCWTFTGAVGGAGSTTVAIEVATLLADRAAGHERVCLVDLNLADGSAASYLGAASNMLLAPASASPDRIDASLIEAFASKVEGDFDLLSGPRDPRAFQQVSAEAVVRLLDAACQHYDYVVVDVPRHRQDWTLDVLAGADEVVIVSELTVPALIAARSLAAEIEHDLPERMPPRIVLNRLAKRMLGAAPSIAEAERALQRKADGAITSDWEAASASVNLGGPISHHRPRSKLVKDVEEFVERLLAASPPPLRQEAPPPAPAPASPLARMFQRPEPPRADEEAA